MTRRRVEFVGVAAVLLIAALAHGFNMFHFPYYQDDEGTYVAQAWALLRLGNLSHYTYWYDHAPGGWMQIALWNALTGGIHAFGTAVDSGRVFMLLVHMLSTVLVIKIGRDATGSLWVGLVAALLFSLSAYGIYWQRRVLLDNLAVMWLLAAMALVTAPRITLARIWLSAIALGIAVLSKELMIFVAPVLLALVVVRTTGAARWFAAVGWPALFSSVFSLYFLMALLRGELFPATVAAGERAQHVSLLGGLAYQMSRQRDGGLFDMQSRFWHHMQAWLHEEPLLVIGGVLGGLVMLLFVRRQPQAAAIAASTFALFAFLARGGEVLALYLVPLIPLLALNVVISAHYLVVALAGAARPLSAPVLREPLRGIVAGALVGCIGFGYAASSGDRSSPLALWRDDQTADHRHAAEWVRQNIVADAIMVADNAMWTDLRQPPDDALTAFAHVHWYWKVDLDPEVREDILAEDWRLIDYVLLNPGLASDAESGLELVREAIRNSAVVAVFDTEDWPVEVRRVIRTEDGPPRVPPGPVAQHAPLADDSATMDEADRGHVNPPDTLPANPSGIVREESAATTRPVALPDTAARARPAPSKTVERPHGLPRDVASGKRMFVSAARSTVVSRSAIDAISCSGSFRNHARNCSPTRSPSLRAS